MRKQIIILLLSLSLFGCDRFLGDKVCFGDKCFSVEVAATPQAMARGLMFREHLDQDKGMLFVFSGEVKRSFFMKNTRIPLDMIWINKDNEIVHIERNVPAEKNGEYKTVFPGVLAQYVLELNAGAADDIGLKIGDKADICIK